MGQALLAHQCTVSRQLVHRSGLGEVLLTGWRAVGTDSFLVGAQWPRAHAFYEPVAGAHDPLLTPETIRQAGLLLAHTEYQVPLDHVPCLRELSYDIDAAALPFGPAPAELLLHVVASEVHRRGPDAFGLRLQVEVYLDDVRIGGGAARFDWLAPGLHERLRAHRPAPARTALPAPVAASLAGRSRGCDVVLAATEQPRQWELRADPAHPVLFDEHDADGADGCVPGQLLLEAVRQACHCAEGDGAALLPLSLSARFLHHAELDAPVRLSVTPPHGLPGGDRVLEVRAEQHGRTVADATVRVRRG
ncbi:ScbA/BarX family gamma-butyrolactone biosynthesis protein [Kitasatospora sp. NPDC002040]|uniref:ScbA/BarX family gamma-butyrolactone biosynthesis protein n=1 Tax=Kitasatospora sp. NPDC002040 TaxID=3154661 RepID=UPI003331874A